MTEELRREIKLGFVGDFCLHQIKNKSAEHQANSLEFCQNLNANVDLAIANHEFSILKNAEDVGWMSISEEEASNISDSGFDVFCLANNHIGDYGPDGLSHTKLYLEQKGHKIVGIGNSISEACEPLYIDQNGFKIGIVNFCDATQYAATDRKPGLAKLDKSLIEKAIREAKENADLVIVSIHADLEFTNYPAPWRVSLSRSLAKLGPDLIIQHHPHCLQGIEYAGNTLIAYSLGNFIFSAFGNSYGEKRPGHVDESVYMTVIVKDGVDGKRTISYELIPVMIDENNVSYHPEPEKGREILNKMEEYSAALSDGGMLRKHYYELCRAEMATLLSDTYYRTAKRGLLAGFKYFAKHFKTKAHTNWMRGFFTFGKY